MQTEVRVHVRWEWEASRLLRAAENVPLRVWMAGVAILHLESPRLEIGQTTSRQFRQMGPRRICEYDTDG